jgi:hypothetical protein
MGSIRRGQLVIVKSLEEILATLDADGRLDGLPLMPEMIPFCGGTFRVHRRAEKTCVEGLGMRGMDDTVFLADLRCDGAAHDGCQRGCLFFWKEAWLKPSPPAPLPKGEGRNTPPSPPAPLPKGEGRNTPPSPPGTLWVPLPKGEGRMTPWQPVPRPLPTMKDGRYYCQSTELANATTEFRRGKLGNYFRDIRIGELSPRKFCYFLWMAVGNRLWRVLFGRYLHQLIGRRTRTPPGELDLKPGELVEILPADEIRETLDSRGRNRGLSFEPEMALHCGRRYRVAGQIRRIILEENGRMVQLANTVTLDGLDCRGLCALNCPRANHFYWREIWLRRV